MLLNAVAQSTTVDATRRRTAADKLKEVDFLGTDVHELPQAAKPAPSPPPQSEPIPSKLPKPILAADPWSAPASAPSPKARPAAQAPAAPEPPTGRANELALQGPDGEAKARAQLEAKVSSGRVGRRHQTAARDLPPHG
jgi:hypothetical protein